MGFGIPHDPELQSEAVKMLRKADKVLAKIIDLSGPMKLEAENKQSPYEALAEAIVYQQLNGRAAETIFNRVQKAFGGRGKKFPKPEDFLKMPDEPLRAAGLSRAKLLALRDLSAKAAEGFVPSHRQILKMEDSEIIEKLDTIRGIGKWTVEMLLIFKLGRPDILPVDDYGVRRGFAKAYRKKVMPTPKELLAFGERWRPYRTTASWYLWRAAEMKP